MSGKHWCRLIRCDGRRFKLGAPVRVPGEIPMRFFTRLLATVVVAGAFHVAPVSAETLQVDELTCNDLEAIFKKNAESGQYFLIWLEGYVSGVAEDPSMDTDYTEMFIGGIVDACKADGTRRVLEVAREVGLDE